ncbi:PNGase F N-terminal domain-containing protein [Sphingobacterium sp. LRF_L2]|uniref:PNGase F N-terminal domain-containing protein n=1 Tax=Sphingobacterium sp. LRF_L2 TaxID=3369421 RepID=UPI003F5F9F7B
MKFIISILPYFLFSLLHAQSYKVTYQQSYHDKTSAEEKNIIVFTDSKQTVITSTPIIQSLMPYPYEVLYIYREQNNHLYKVTNISADREIATLDTFSLEKNSINLNTTDRKQILGYNCKKATLSVNSNQIELWYTTELHVKGAPNEFGQNIGLVLEYVRNGNTKITATKIEKIKHVPSNASLRSFSPLVDPLTYQDELWRSRFIQVPIFKNEQINFTETPKSDSIIRFAHGTVILKRVKIPAVDKQGQAFIQLIEKSNGDAYDRTGSVFMIAEDQAQTFLDGMKNGMHTLPLYDNGDGQKYPGMVRTTGYSPLLELMRFFTPFGIAHFNNRLTLKDKTWQDSVIYRQDISEFLSLLSGKEVYIGAYIGNYDKGGHTISLEMTFHKGLSKMNYTHIIPIFNSTNVMEMGGQTYATFFSQQHGLEVTFDLPKAATDVQLRYISTGHGGWENGDEFVPKENSIYIDNKLIFKFTPWRTDCGSYRLFNPVSGNFQNGLSSSDLSRSNWCPGTVTTPNYINLGNLPEGKHTIRVHIPQGAPEGNSFSFWNVSGAILYN